MLIIHIYAVFVRLCSMVENEVEDDRWWLIDEAKCTQALWSFDKCVSPKVNFNWFFLFCFSCFVQHRFRHLINSKFIYRSNKSKIHFTFNGFTFFFWFHIADADKILIHKFQLKKFAILLIIINLIRFVLCLVVYLFIVVFFFFSF